MKQVTTARLEKISHLLSHLHGEVTALERSYSDVLSVLRRLESQIQIDDLTGLLRRNSFFAQWEQLLAECQSLNESAGMLVIDIDHFKRINDTHGHPTGDEVIKKIAALLKQYESPHCVVGRLGGEEFVIGIRGTDAELLGTAEFIRRGAERLYGPVIGPDGEPQPSVQWKCTLSVGLATSRTHGHDARRLLTSADEALYDAKAEGRNRVRAA